MKQEDELQERFQQRYNELFSNPRDFEMEVMNQPEPKTPRYLALKKWRALPDDEKQRKANAYMDTHSQPRRNWQSLTGREIENIAAII